MYNDEFTKEAGIRNRIANLASRSKDSISRRLVKTPKQKSKRIRNEDFNNELKIEISKAKGRARERAYDTRMKNKRRSLRSKYQAIEGDNTTKDKVKRYLKSKTPAGRRKAARDAERAKMDEPTFLEQHGGKILAGTAAAGAAGGGYYLYKKKKKENQAKRMGYRG